MRGQHQGTGTTPGGSQPRFPGYDVVGQRPTWDDETAGVVLARLGPPPPIRFFTEEEQPCARALVDRLLAQDDDPKVPVLEVLDRRLLERDGDGYRYEDMPEDWDAWRRSIAGLDADSQARFGARFHELDQDQQMAMLEEVRTAGGEKWGMPAKRLFSVWLRYACTAFYAHPWAWNEIGFGGPAYPRGYASLGLDHRETWERPERDAHDPIPWVQRAEDQRKRHIERLERGAGGPDGGPGAPREEGAAGSPDAAGSGAKGSTGWGGAHGSEAGGEPSGGPPGVSRAGTGTDRHAGKEAD